MTDRWQRIPDLFGRALALPLEARAAFLAEACSDDEESRHEVEELLKADANCIDDGFLRNPIADAISAMGTGEVTRVGQLLGEYELIGELGRGGMGRVYLARRADQQYQAEVAIKFVQGAFASPELIGRFRTERQILADLTHPNIARLLDGGSTPDGTPYLVMERVSGEAIDHYCDHHGLGVRQRVKLFLQVTSAVQYAHQALVVHRDLKPSNILVTADGVPKLLDFGIAKLVDPEAGEDETTLLRALTPAYASPEQVRGERVTVATDVYSLGVILYKLLAGREPFQLRGLTPGELEHQLMEVDPTLPSQVVRQEGRGADRPDQGWSKELAGDLDTIVMKALGKLPADRYPSIAALAEDLRRHLDGRPVLARRATAGYRAAKFVRRHRQQVTLVLAALATLMGVTGWYLLRLGRERDGARQEAAKAAEVAGFLRGLFEVSDPSRSRGETVTARELLDQGASRIRQELADQPQVQAEMMQVIGQVYQGLGLNDQAQPLLLQALEQSRSLYPALHPEVATTSIAYGTLLQDMGRLAEAEPLLRQGLADRVRLFGPSSPEVSEAERALAFLLETRGHQEQAESLYRSALAHDRILYPAGDSRITESTIRLGGLLRRIGRLAEAEPLLREGLASQRRVYGDRDLRVASTARNLAALLRDQGNFAESERLYQEALATRRSILGEDHPEVATTMNSYALLLQQEGKLDSALIIFRRFTQILERIYPEPHPSLAAGYNNLGFGLLDARRYEEAAKAFQRSISVQDRVYRPDHPNRAHPLVGLAAARMGENRFAEAEPLLRQAMSLRLGGLAPGRHEIGEVQSDLGACLTELRRYAAAESLLVSGYRILQTGLGIGDRRTQRALGRLVALYDEWDKPDQARRYRMELPATADTVSPAAALLSR